MRIIFRFVFVNAVAALLSFSCSKVQMSPIGQGSSDGSNSAASVSSPSSDGEPGSTSCPAPCPDLGLKGGHFDLDTSHLVYNFNKGRTDHHEHEYDDKHDVKEVNFFDMLDREFTTIASQVKPTQEFIIIVVNSALSPGGILEINGQSVSVVDYQKRVADYFNGNGAALSTFTLVSLSDFKLKFSGDDLSKAILVPTDTKCVQANKPSARGEYRNGALTIQILDKATAKISAAYKAATLDGGLLWEATVFWHRDQNCQ